MFVERWMTTCQRIEEREGSGEVSRKARRVVIIRRKSEWKVIKIPSHNSSPLLSHKSTIMNINFRDFPKASQRAKLQQKSAHEIRKISRIFSSARPTACADASSVGTVNRKRRRKAIKWLSRLLGVALCRFAVCCVDHEWVKFPFRLFSSRVSEQHKTHREAVEVDSLTF